MDKNSRKQVAKISVFITSIFVIFLSVTYAFINMTVTGVKRQVITSGMIDVIFEEDNNNLAIENAMPTYDEVGMIQDPFTFRLTNTGNKVLRYTVKLVKTDLDNELSEKFVRVGLVKNNVSKTIQTLSLLEGTRKEETVAGTIPREPYRKGALKWCQENGKVSTEEECLTYFQQHEGIHLENFNGVIDYYILYLISENPEKVQAGTRTKVLHYWKIIGKFGYGYQERIETEEDCVKFYKANINENINSFEEIVETFSEIPGFLDNRNKNELVLENGLLGVKETISYELRLWIDANVEDEEDIVEKTLSYKIFVDEIDELPGANIIKNFSMESYNEGSDYFEYVSEITSVVLEDNINIPSNAIKSWDISANQNGSVMAYIEENGVVLESKNTTAYKLHMQAKGKIIANKSTSFLFVLPYLVSIENLSNLDTSNTEIMAGMFSLCYFLTTLDLSSFDTSNVINMAYMFYNCSSLTSLDVSHFDISNVTSMSFMFANCSSLTSLDVSHFNTSNVTDMSHMFGGCSSLSNLDLSGLDTSKVTDMSGFLAYSASLTNENLSKLNTANVTNMDGMLAGYSNPEPLDLKLLDISNVTSTASMFENYSSSAKLDLSPWNTSNITDMSDMFSHYSSNQPLDLSHFDTSNVTDMSYMFYKYSSSQPLDLSNFNTSSVTNMAYMFSNYNSNGLLDISNFDFSNNLKRKDNIFSSFEAGQLIVKDEAMKTWVLEQNSSLTNVVVKST